MSIISQYDRKPATPSNISDLAPLYPGLSSLRKEEQFKGMILTHHNDVVAMLQCDVSRGIITTVEVAPDYRGHGIAKELLTYACDKLHCRSICVKEDNDIAIHICGELGFKLLKKQQGEYCMYRL